MRRGTGTFEDLKCVANHTRLVIISRVSLDYEVKKMFYFSLTSFGTRVSMLKSILGLTVANFIERNCIKSNTTQKTIYMYIQNVTDLMNIR